MKLSSLATDEKLSTEGVWVDYVDGARLLVARTGNKHFRDYCRARFGKVGRTFRAEELLTQKNKNGTTSREEAIVREGVAKHVLRDWEGIEDDDGNPLPYTPEQGLEAFEKYPEFLDDVLSVAGDVQNFKDAGVEEATGNSSTD